MKFCGEAKIVKKEWIADDVFKIHIEKTDAMGEVLPGQFFNFQSGTMPMLRRPISVSLIMDDALEFVVKVVGEGTKFLSNKKVGDTINSLGPLGRGYNIEADKKSLLVGGGIGIAPIKEVAKQLSRDTSIILGFSDDPYDVADFKGYSDYVTTVSERCEADERGFVTGPLEKCLKEGTIEMVYTCGPTPMLKAVQALCKTYDVEVQLLIEEKMACGIGACLSCTCKQEKEGKIQFVRSCKEGPMFYRDEVIF